MVQAGGASDVVARQRAALEALYRRHVGPGDRYALLDCPDHPNVGDSAIWLGELALLRAITGRDPDHVATWHGFDAAAFVADSPAGVIFLHGGGNLGDIWPHHQRFRQDVIARFRDRRIVQLPQSIHFRDPHGLARFAAVAGAHPDLHLCVRDAASHALVARHLDAPVTLAPDSAFALDDLVRAEADCPVLMLLRTDAERVAQDRTALADMPGAVTLDWLVDGPLPPGGGHAAVARARVDRGVALLSRGERIVTDRLHAHILALLLGIPHVVLDNEYGKIAAYAAAWTAGSPLLLAQAASAAEAMAALA